MSRALASVRLLRPRLLTHRRATDSEFAYAWKAEVIAWLRNPLPDANGYWGRSNLEFVAQGGSVNEVDALILTPPRLLLVEIKSRPGRVQADRSRG